MKSRCFLLTLFAVVFAPGLLHAQEYQFKKSKIIGAAYEVVPNYDKMYEDIEILRHIVNRKLTSLYPRKLSRNSTAHQILRDAANNGWDIQLKVPNTNSYLLYNTTQQPSRNLEEVVLLNKFNRDTAASEMVLPSLEGVYLKGQGVVYTATLASLQPSAKFQADSSDTGRVEFILRESEWDSIRRQVRNEKERPKKPEESKPPSLSNVLLKVLADNGHHFSQLGEGERLTIVLTVHEESPSSPAAKSGTGSTKAASNPTPRDIDADAAREARHFEMLGELYLKQAKYHEALMVFQRWLERTESPKQEADVRRKLAQCYLMQGQDEKARTELDKAIELLKKGKEAKENPAAAKPAAALPVKLIVSAPKKLLDQVKAGKITFEEFRRQASVETLRFGDRR